MTPSVRSSVDYCTLTYERGRPPTPLLLAGSLKRVSLSTYRARRTPLASLVGRGSFFALQLSFDLSISAGLSSSRSQEPQNDAIVSHCRGSDRLSGILLLPLLRCRLVDAPELDGSRIDPCQQAAYRRQFAGNARLRGKPSGPHLPSPSPGLLRACVPTVDG